MLNNRKSLLAGVVLANLRTSQRVAHPVPLDLDGLGDLPNIPAELRSMNHPNRNPNSAARTPTPSVVKAAREAARLNCDEAGALVYERGVRWAAFELGDARMHPATFELFLIKTGQA